MIQRKIKKSFTPLLQVYSEFFDFIRLNVQKPEPAHDKTSKMTCAPREDSDQPGHPPSHQSLRCAFSG